MRRIIVMALLLLLPVLAVVVKTTGHAGTVGGDTAATPRWEYLAVAGPSTTNFTPTGNPSMRKEDAPFAREGFVLEQHLDKLGAKGWELVSVAGMPSDPVYYFKRQR
ncbi:MAG TPA: hypothetical protein VGJ55_15335 [Pyrinomonadaceae bacterium]